MPRYRGISPVDEEFSALMKQGMFITIQFDFEKQPFFYRGRKLEDDFNLIKKSSHIDV